MDFEDETWHEATEEGSDELLSQDDLRLPAGASILVQLHATRAWLARRLEEIRLQVGESALDLQVVMRAESQETRPRRHERERQVRQQLHVQQALIETQERLDAYEEAQTLLEEYIAHTSGQRVLVEYYLALEELLLSDPTTQWPAEKTPRMQALAEVQQHIERLSTPDVE
ncbi:MAG: hypothetical protein ABI456_17240 [Ktedonobacteraceae bacterium]